MAQKLADELIYPKPPGHDHVVLETARARLGIQRFNHRFNYFFCFSAFASASSKIASTGFISVHSTRLSMSR